MNNDLQKKILENEGWLALPEKWGGLEKSPEVMRLLKLHKYISSLAKSIVPDLVPSDAWQNMINYEAVIIAHQDNINNATQNMEHLLEICVPYKVTSSKVAEAYAAAFEEERKRALELIDQFSEQVKEAENLKSELIKLKQAYENIKKYYSELFEGTDDNPSLETIFNDFHETTKEMFDGVKVFHDELLVDRNKEDD